MGNLRWAYAVALLGVGCGGADPSAGGDDAGAVGGDAADAAGGLPDAGAAPWPSQWTALPSCTPYPDGFVEPEVAAPTGAVALVFSTPWQPIGVPKSIVIEIRDAITYELDTSATGVVQLETSTGATVVSVSPVAAGVGEAVVVVNEPGLHTLSAALTSSGVTGRAELWGYATQLPVWNVDLLEQDLSDLLADPDSRLKVPTVLRVDGTSYPGYMRLHGGSSRWYSKKSFRIDLDLGHVLPDGSNHLIVRAEWNDKSLLRNYLGYEVFRNGTWLPTPLAEFIHFRINGQYYGLLLHVERIDGDFLQRNSLPRTGSMYEADPASSSYFVPGGNLTPLESRTAYLNTYDHKKGSIDYDDLIELIEVILQLDESAFDDVVEYVVRVNDYLVYMAAMAAIQNQDHIRKNYYIYRDTFGADDRWQVFPWDLELTFGHLWTEENDVLDETIFTDGKLRLGEQVPEHGYYNQLMHRLWSTPAYDARFVQYLQHISDEVLTPEFIDGRIDNALCRATPEILADWRKRASNDEFLDRVQELRLFAAERRLFIDSQ